jgi:hypothetical protein
MSGGSPKAVRVVRTRVRTRPATPAPEVLPPDQELGQAPVIFGEPDKDIRHRLRQIFIWHGQKAAAEFARRQVLAMHFAGMSSDMMAEKLGVTVRTIERYRADIRRTHAQRPQNIDAGEMVGEILAYYEHQIHMPMQGFLTAKNAEERAKAQMVGLKAQSDKVKFLKEWGFLTHNAYRAPITNNDNGAGRGKVEKLLEDLREILS